MHSFLVTGAAGFIGSNLVDALLSLGHQVTALDNLSNGRADNLADLQNHPEHRQRFRFIEGDIRDAQCAESACEGVDYVLHQAALGSVPRSISEPQLYHDNNVTGTLNMLMAARNAKVKRFVWASSSSVYGDTPTLPKIETMIPQPKSPYALGKLFGEYYSRFFFEEYGLPTIALRYFNVFGKRQDPHSEYAAVIPKFITALRRGESPIIYSDGHQTRDFTHVDNVVSANLKACEAPQSACGKAYNIGCGDRISILELATALQQQLNPTVPIEFRPTRAGDVRDSQASIAAAKSAFGYTPQISLEEGLKITIPWYLH